MTSMPIRGVVTHAADAERLDFPDGSSISLLVEGDGTSTSMTVHRTRLRSGAQGAAPHHHESTTELIIVVSGSLEVMVGELELSVGAGDVAVIPPGVTHAFRAAPGCDADVFDVVTPGVERFDMFRNLTHALGGSPWREEPNNPDPTDPDPAQYDTYADDRVDWRPPSQPTARAFS